MAPTDVAEGRPSRAASPLPPRKSLSKALGSEAQPLSENSRTNPAAKGCEEAKTTVAPQEQAKPALRTATQDRLSSVTGRPARLVMVAVPTFMLAIALFTVTTIHALGTEPLGRWRAWLARSTRSIR